MDRNRAPRGIPTGGQFVATPRPESGVSLAALNKARREDWDLRKDLEYFAQNAEAAGSHGDPSFGGALEPVVEDRQEPQEAPDDTLKGTFVTWDQLLPRFLRRR